MVSVKRMSIAVLSVVCWLAGCSPLDDPFWKYRRGQIERYQAEVRRQYEAEIAAHAARGELLGTWGRRDRLPTKTLRWTIQTLALFHGGTYVHRTARGGELLNASPTVVTGTWKKIGPGQIQLTVTGKWREEPRGKAKLVPPQTAETRTIDLKEWSNPFVEADAALMSEAAMDSGGRPHTRTAE